jgi:hypothetical protein
VGPIYGWRPGWAEPKQISQGLKAYNCGAHFSADLAICLENLTPMDPLQLDVTAGPLGAAKTIARVTATRPGTMSSQFSVTLTRAGDYVIYSTGGLLREQVENLYVVKASDLAGAAPVMPMKVADNISRWRLSVDNKQIYYLRGYNYSTEGDPSGNLMVADFPSMANERMLAPKVGLFQVLFDGTENNRGVGFFDNVVINKGTYKIMRDIAMPAATATVASDVSSISLSRDLRYVYFTKEFDQGLTDAWVGNANGGTPCLLTNSVQSALFGTPFTIDSSMVFWADLIDRTDGVGEFWYAPVEGCGVASNKKKFADRGDYWFPYRSDGMIFSDDGVGETFTGSATLKYAPLTGRTSVGMHTVVQTQIGRPFGIMPNYEGILYSISGNAQEGLYVYGMIPFVSPRDGGAGN